MGLSFQQRSEEDLSGEPMAVGSRRCLSECQENRDANTEEGYGYARSNGDIVNSTGCGSASAREGGTMSH
jgi:hypothetical protein